MVISAELANYVEKILASASEKKAKHLKLLGKIVSNAIEGNAGPVYISRLQKSAHSHGFAADDMLDAFRGMQFKEGCDENNHLVFEFTENPKLLEDSLQFLTQKYLLLTQPPDEAPEGGGNVAEEKLIFDATNKVLTQIPLADVCSINRKELRKQVAAYVGFPVDDSWRKAIVKKAAQLWVDQTFQAESEDEADPKTKEDEKGAERPHKEAPRPLKKEVQVFDLRDIDLDEPQSKHDDKSKLFDNDDLLDELFSDDQLQVNANPAKPPEIEDEDIFNDLLGDEKEKPKISQVKKEEEEIDMAHIETQLRSFLSSKLDDLQQKGVKELITDFQMEIGVAFTKPVRKRVKKIAKEIGMELMKSQFVEESQKIEESLDLMADENPQKEQDKDDTDIFANDKIGMKMGSKRKSDLLGIKEKKKKRKSVNELLMQAKRSEQLVKKREDVWVFIPNKTTSGNLIGNVQGSIATLKIQAERRKAVAFTSDGQLYDRIQKRAKWTGVESGGLYIRKETTMENLKPIYHECLANMTKQNTFKDLWKAIETKLGFSVLHHKKELKTLLQEENAVKKERSESQKKRPGDNLQLPLPKRPRFAKSPRGKSFPKPEQPGQGWAAFWLWKSPHVPKQHNEMAMSMSEIISGNVRRAVMYSYLVDVKYLVNVCPKLLSIPKVDFVHGQKDAHEKWKIDVQEVQAFCESMSVLDEHESTASMKLHLCKSSQTWGLHHSKLIILYYEEGVRIVISSANFIQGCLENKTNALWIQDFPRKTSRSKPQSEFEESLLYYLDTIKDVNIDNSRLREFDFEAATCVLVPSVPGSHTGKIRDLYGLLRVKDQLSKEQIPRDIGGAPLVCNHSSFGTFSQNWLSDQFILAMRQASNSDGRGSGDIRIVWPRVKDMQECLEGWVAGSSIFLKKMHSREWLRDKFRRWNAKPSGRHKMMPHIKTYCRVSKDQLAWFMVGSHNISKAAWGESQKGDKFHVRHYELSVLFLPSKFPWGHRNLGFRLTDSFKPMRAPKRRPDKSFLVRRKFGTNAVLFPIPFETYDSEKYAVTDNPWVQNKPFQQHDMHGRTWNGRNACEPVHS